MKLSEINTIVLLLVLTYLRITTSQIIRDVIVVGAGISGLNAAKILKENGLDVIVIEARDRVGGRTFTIHNPNVDYVDLGGSYVGSRHLQLRNLIDELDLHLYDVYNDGDDLYFSNGKSVRWLNDNPPLGGILNNIDVNNVLNSFKRVSDQIPANEPWNAPNAQAWDQMTYKEWVIQNARTKAAQDYALTLSTDTNTAEAYEISMLWFVWNMKQSGGYDAVFTEGDLNNKIINGSQQITQRIADILGCDRVLLNKPVIEITQTNDSVIVQTLDGTEYQAKYLINSIAAPLQQKIKFSPPLPPLRNQLLQRNPIGSVIKTIVYYKTPFWRKDRYTGSVMTAVSEKHPIDDTVDDTKPDGAFPAIVGFLVANKSREYQELPQSERVRRIVKQYAIAFNNNEALNPIHYEEYNWNADEYAGGCYNTIGTPGFVTTFAKILNKPIGRMHFTGSDISNNFPGYMEGAVETGRQVAEEILAIISND